MSNDGQTFRWSMGALLVRITTGTIEALRIAVAAAAISAKSTRLFNDRTGYLRQNIKGESYGFKGRVIAQAKYAVFVENGHRPHTAPRPFMAEAKMIGEEILVLGVNNALEFAIETSKKV